MIQHWFACLPEVPPRHRLIVALEGAIDKLHSYVKVLRDMKDELAALELECEQVAAMNWTPMEILSAKMAMLRAIPPEAQLDEF